MNTAFKAFVSFAAPLAFLAFAGCGVSVEPNHQPLDIKSEKPEPKPDSCQILRSEFKPAVAEVTAPAATHKVERQFQRVIRYGCDGQVTSDKVETVQSPTLNFDVKLDAPWPHKSVFVFNETSCDHKLTRMPQSNPLFSIVQVFAVTGDGDQRISIWGDIAQALLTFNMNQGLNNLYVRYYADCMPTNVSGNEHVIVGDDKVPSCGENPKTKTVLYPVNVEYSEKTLEGVKEIKATDCK